MKIKKVYMKFLHGNHYRSKEMPEVVGVNWFVPDGREGRFCYKLQYNDDEINYVPFSDIEGGTCKLINETEFVLKNLRGETAP